VSWSLFWGEFWIFGQNEEWAGREDFDIVRLQMYCVSRSI